jgi:hypothetical protein
MAWEVRMSELNPQSGEGAPSVDPVAAEADGMEPDVSSTVGPVEDDGVEAAAAESRHESPSNSDVSRLAETSAELDGLADLDLAEHPDVYQRIHADLQSALSAIDDA